MAAPRIQTGDTVYTAAIRRSQQKLLRHRRFASDFSKSRDEAQESTSVSILPSTTAMHNAQNHDAD